MPQILLGFKAILLFVLRGESGGGSRGLQWSKRASAPGLNANAPTVITRANLLYTIARNALAPEETLPGLKSETLRQAQGRLWSTQLQIKN
jgi:hypothetical protein